MTENEKIANLLFPNVTIDPQFYIDKYKRRKLENNTYVTRFAPSPTGYVHMGSLLTVFYDYIFAKQSKGIFYLRIEDTDLERTIENGVEGIVNDLKSVGISPCEGIDENLINFGDYGPYVQTQRQEIYLSFAKYLVKKGLAYPCFCSKEELDKIREEQELNKEVQIGYYGKYAKCRNLTYEQVKQKLLDGKKFVIRFKAQASVGDRVKFVDKIRGEIEMSDCINDVIILKSDSLLPPYNFAHAIDDSLMGTNLVIRSNEWLNSVPEHLQLFKALGFEPPEYAHIAFVQKIDEQTGTKRKISKRKDPETAVANIIAEGYPKEAIWEYLYTLANTDFEDWRLKNPDLPLENFNIKFDKISLSGALFDINKFNDVSKNVISRFNATKVYDDYIKWAQIYNKKWYDLAINNKEYFISMFNIDRENKKPRKDILKWNDVSNLYEYMINDYYYLYKLSNFEVVENLDKQTIQGVLNDYLSTYNENDEKDVWFNKIKEFCPKNGFCSEVKEYKKNPNEYYGHCGTVCTIIRIALTGKQNSPDLYAICKLLGKDEMKNRFNYFLNLLS